MHHHFDRSILIGLDSVYLRLKNGSSECMIKVEEDWIYGKKREGRLYLCIIHSKNDLQNIEEILFENTSQFYPQMCF